MKMTTSGSKAARHVANELYESDEPRAYESLRAYEPTSPLSRPSRLSYLSHLSHLSHLSRLTERSSVIAVCVERLSRAATHASSSRQRQPPRAKGPLDFALPDDPTILS